MPPSLSRCSPIASCGIFIKLYLHDIYKYNVLDLAHEPYESTMITYTQNINQWQGLGLDLLAMIPYNIYIL